MLIYKYDLETATLNIYPNASAKKPQLILPGLHFPKAVKLAALHSIEFLYIAYTSTINARTAAQTKASIARQFIRSVIVIEE